MALGTTDVAPDIRKALNDPEHTPAYSYAWLDKAPDYHPFSPTENEQPRLLATLMADPNGGEKHENQSPGIADESSGPIAVPQREASEVPESSAPLTAEDVRNLNAVLGYEVAANTQMNYQAQWRRFAAWAQSKNIRVFPADPMQVAAYLAERSARYGHKPATLRAAAAAISHTHRVAGFDDPCDTHSVKTTLRSASCKAGSFQRQAAGLTAQALEAIYATACQPRRGRGGRMERPDTAMRRGRMDIAMISLMRDALLRVSEAAALKWEDLTTEADGTGRLLIRRSKTDQEGQGTIAFVSAATMENLKAIREGTSGGDSILGLRPNQIAKRIKQAAAVAGLGEGFSGHSPRVGMARDLARVGTELPRLMTAGRWRSPRMPALYTRNEAVSRGAVAQYYGGCRPSPSSPR